jgi:hypothetical protein
MANIVIVAATGFGKNNELCFLAGLASCSGWEPKPGELPRVQSKGNCSLAYLRERVKQAKDSKPDLIVTVEGLAMAQAAALELQEDDPKFISLSDHALGWKPIALAGGVNMNTSAGDEARKTLLKSTFATVRDESIYLVVNNNSPSLPNQTKYWPPRMVARFFHDKENPPKAISDENENHFIAEFETLAKKKPRPTGLVIAADPYFWYFRTAFTTAVANSMAIPVCYPFQDFVDACEKTGNRDNSIAWNKPPLNNASNSGDEATAFFQLGKQVGKFLAGTEDVGVVTWSGSNWELQPDLIPPKPTGSCDASEAGIELEALEIRVKGRVAEIVLQDLLTAVRRRR